MKNWKKLVKIQVLRALMLLALAAFAPSIVQAQNSAAGSKNSGTDASRETAGGSKSKVQGSKAEIENHPPAKAVPLLRKEGSLQDLINSCAAAVEDLAKTRILAEALERENGLLRERLETEKRTSAVLLELNETRKAEAVSLRETVAAKNEALSAKDQVIAAQDKLIETLKKKKTSPLKRLGDVLIGVGLLAVFR